MYFADRRDAGRRLAEQLLRYRGGGTLVLAIPRGGVVIGLEVAEALGCQLDIITPRKLKDPEEPELAIGAVTPDGSAYLNEDVISVRRVSAEYIVGEKAREQKEALRRLSEYRGSRPYPSLAGKTVIIVDDGIATGATMIAAARDARGMGATSVVIAAPVAPDALVSEMSSESDEFVCLLASAYFAGVGQFYDRFEQVEDSEVMRILNSYWSSFGKNKAK